MHAINYEAPKTLKDAVALLAQHGEKGRPLCGGTDLIIQLRAGVRRPEFVVDVKKIHELMHLKRMDHSPAFWKLVAAACPDFKASRAWLRAYSKEQCPGAPHGP